VRLLVPHVRHEALRRGEHGEFDVQPHDVDKPRQRLVEARIVIRVNPAVHDDGPVQQPDPQRVEPERPPLVDDQPNVLAVEIPLEQAEV
jgi:hypothetical protein